MRSRFVPLRARAALGLALVFQIAAGASAVARAELVRDPLWVTDGEVRAVACVDNTIYLGGAFSKVGPAVGGFGTFDAAGGASVPPFVGVAGTVNAILPDGAGGYYIGGSFTGVKGQARNNLAHIDASGAATSWDPNVTGVVHALALHGSTVYVGGSFILIGGQVRTNLAAVDAATGAVGTWSPNPNGAVKVLTATTTRLFVGGAFHVIAGQTHHLIASFDESTNALESWAPAANTSSGSVEAISTFGTRVFVAGAFTIMGGQSRYNLASVDATTGLATTWVANVSGAVYAMVVTQILGIPTSIPTVWIGGSFTSVSSTSRLSLAAIDGDTGAVKSFDPGANGTVRALIVRTSQLGIITSFFAGGEFSTIGGAPRPYIASISSSGTSNAWTPLPTGPVHAMLLVGGNVVAGGAFYSANMTARANIAALDATTGELTPFNLGANGPVNTFLVYGRSLYVGGEFNLIGTDARTGAAEVNMDTYFVSPWNPILDCADLSCSTPTVNAIVRTYNATIVYLGGSFSGSWSQPRRNLVATNANTGSPLDFNVNANFAVRALAARRNPNKPNDVVTLFAAGDFNRVNAGLFSAGSGGTIRYGLVALDPATGEATSWNPSPNTTSSVHALEYTSTGISDPGIVWVGGQFPTMGGQTRNNVAALDGETGLATAWDPNANGVVRAMLRTPTGITLGGDFTAIGGATRNHVACVDGGSGTPTSWNPDASGGVLALAGNGGTIFAGGGYSQVSRYAHAFFAGIGDGTVTAVESGRAVPAARRFVSAAPNPTGGRTSFRFDLPRREPARVAVYDATGRLVRTLYRGVLESGTHSLDWSGADASEREVASGVYFVRVESPSGVMSAKVLRLR